MNDEYVYDFEVFPNFVGVTFIPRYPNKQLKDAYIRIDKAQLRYKIKTQGQLKTPSNDEVMLGFIEDKRKILDAMGAKTFNVWHDPNDPEEYINQLHLLIDFFKSHKIITGYNSNTYDQNMLDLCLYYGKRCDYRGWLTSENKHFTTFMYDHSVECIAYGKGYSRILNLNSRKRVKHYTGYDIQKILYLDKSFTSLKQVAICLRWHRIQDLPYSYDENIQRFQIVHVNDYNVNDDLITLALMDDQIDELQLRKDLSEEFEMDFMNLSRSSIGKAIATNYYSWFSGLHKKDFEQLRTQRYRIPCRNIISPLIHFKSDPFKKLVSEIMKSTIVVGSKDDKDKFKFEVVYNNLVYTIAKGGLHSKDEPGVFDIYTTEKGYKITDCDVDSYYPNGILKFDVCPAHLDRRFFRAVIGYTKDSRVEAKHENRRIKKFLKEHRHHLSAEEIATLEHKAKKAGIKADGLKIAINRMYGALNDKDDFFYDAKCTYQVTLNLQLALLMLIEELTLAGIQIISANTDGIVAKYREDQEEIYQEVCAKWMKYFDFNLEFTDYERYMRAGVNSYIAIKKGFADALIERANDSKDAIEADYVKRKNDFIKETEFNRGFICPVVSYALNEHLIYGKHYTETIKEHINTSPEAIYDYCISQKSDKKFDIFWTTVHNGEIQKQQLQKSNRFYICDRSIGGGIHKRSKEPTQRKTKHGYKTVYSETRMIVGWNQYVFNDYIEEDDYHVDFRYYNRECSRILEGKSKKDEGVISKTLTNVLFSDDMFEQQKMFGDDTIPEFDTTDDYNKDLDVTPDGWMTQPEVNNAIWAMYGYASEEEYLKGEGLYPDDTQFNDLPF